VDRIIKNGGRLHLIYFSGIGLRGGTRGCSIELVVYAARLMVEEKDFREAISCSGKKRIGTQKRSSKTSS